MLKRQKAEEAYRKLAEAGGLAAHEKLSLLEKAYMSAKSVVPLREKFSKSSSTVATAAAHNVELIGGLQDEEDVSLASLVSDKTQRAQSRLELALKISAAFNFIVKARRRVPPP